MQVRKPANALFCIWALTILIICSSGCKTTESRGIVVVPPAIKGAEFVGMETCAMCHEKIARDFPKTGHARLVVSSESIKGQGCEACHGAGSLHADAQTKQEKHATIVNPRKSPEACYKCHLEKKAEFSLQYHHPVPEGKMSCADCHDPHSPVGLRPDAPNSILRKNEVCAKCHKEQTRPFVFEHGVLREGCSTCHNVHGSINDKMLRERDSNLCLKCHYQTNFPNIGDNTGHNTRVQNGPCFSGSCHDAIHGSNYNKHLKI